MFERAVELFAREIQKRRDRGRVFNPPERLGRGAAIVSCSTAQHVDQLRQGVGIANDAHGMNRRLADRFITVAERPADGSLGLGSADARERPHGECASRRRR